MFKLAKRFVETLCTIAEPATAIMESAIFAAFLTTVLLSFYGGLGSPVLYAGTFAACTIVFLQLVGWQAVCPRTDPAEDTSKFHYYIIAGIVLGLLFLACFMSPDSADEQRIKLARMVIAAKTGSAFETARMDAQSTMYFFPAAYYIIYTAMAAMHSIPAFYPIVSALLVIGSLFNLWLLFGRERSIKHLFWVALFIAAPQFIFSGLSGHEEALTLFLATRAAVWLIVKPLHFRAVVFFLLCVLLCVMVKITSAVFLPGTLFLLLLYFGGKQRLKEWFNPKIVGLALAALVPIGLLVLLPDLLTNQNHGITFAEQQARMAAYHKAGDITCGFTQFYLRLFELGFDFFRNYITFLRLNLTRIIPATDFSFMPSRCVHDSTALIEYFMPSALTRENSQFGPLVLLTLAGLVLVRTKQRNFVVAAWALFLIATAMYSTKLMYWSGTGRYFIVGVLVLLPAFLVTMEAIEEHYSKKIRSIVAWILVLPACFVFISFLENVPKRILRGDRHTVLAGEIVPVLERLKTDKINIYYNDLMSYYTLLRLIPSHDVWLKDALMEDALNIVAIPRYFSKTINWHNKFWLLPVPSTRGEFTFMGRTRGTFGNVVPSAFYMGTPHHPATSGNAVILKPYVPGEDIERWAKKLGSSYRTQRITGKETTLYFIRENNATNGLCIVKATDSALRWYIDRNIPSCQSISGFTS